MIVWTFGLDEAVGVELDGPAVIVAGNDDEPAAGTEEEVSCARLVVKKS